MNERRKRGENPTQALMGLVPFFIQWEFIWAYLSRQPIILYEHLVPFVLFVGLLNAYSVGQMIVGHLIKGDFPYQNVLVVPLLAGLLDSVGPWLKEEIGYGWPSALGSDVYQVAFVFLCLGTAIGVYGSFVVDVIVAICDYLDIWCLTIKHPYHEVGESKKLY
jgi:ethanolaminephosphotransferase